MLWNCIFLFASVGSVLLYAGIDLDWWNVDNATKFVNFLGTLIARLFAICGMLSMGFLAWATFERLFPYIWSVITGAVHV